MVYLNYRLLICLFCMSLLLPGTGFAQKSKASLPMFEVQMDGGFLWLAQGRALYNINRRLYTEYRYSYCPGGWEHGVLFGKTYVRSEKMHVRIGAGMALGNNEYRYMGKDDDDDGDEALMSWGGTMELGWAYFILKKEWFRVGVDAGFNCSAYLNRKSIASINAGIVFGFL